MKLVEVGSQSKIIEAFHHVPKRVYAQDKRYISPILSEVEMVFNASKNQRFRKGKAIRWVLFGEDGCTPIGRIAAFYQDKAGKRWGGWGFFECMNHMEAAQHLILEAEKWLMNEGCLWAQAPINFGSRDAFWGLWISGSRNPSYRENYHPEYYQCFFNAMGYAVEVIQTTYEIDPVRFNMERFEKISERTLSNGHYEFKHLDLKNTALFAHDFVSIYNQAWSFHEDFEPLEEQDLVQQFKKMRLAMLPEMAVFAYHDGKPIGFFISIYELNELFKRFNGSLNLLNQLRFLIARHQIKTVKGLVFGIIPSFQNKGVEAGLIMTSFRSLTKKNRFHRMELSWIGDFNPKMISMLNALGAEEIKRHHTYKKFFS